jgi:hypothetical protein
MEGPTYGPTCFIQSCTFCRSTSSQIPTRPGLQQPSGLAVGFLIFEAGPSKAAATLTSPNDSPSLFWTTRHHGHCPRPLTSLIVVPPTRPGSPTFSQHNPIPHSTPTTHRPVGSLACLRTKGRGRFTSTVSAPFGFHCRGSLSCNAMDGIEERKWKPHFNFITLHCEQLHSLNSCRIAT